MRASDIAAVADEPYRDLTHGAAIDCLTPSLDGMMMRTRVIPDAGLFRIARRTCSLYSVEIKTCGSWGRILIYDEHDNVLFYQPSAFTGSFVIDGCAWDGLYLLSDCGNGKTPPLLTVGWREKDAKMV